jgi:O-antigen/teichoic acid export membrane protein
VTSSLRRTAQMSATRLLRVVRANGSVDDSTEVARGHERTRRAALTSLTGIASRLLAAAASIITVPILLGYLGIERYGIWLTISAGAAWLGLVQFGLAPSLINRMSALDRTDSRQAARLVSTTWLLEVLLGIIALVPLAILYEFATWQDLFNVPAGPLADDARTITVVVWMGLAIGLPLNIPGAVLRARQEGYVANGLDVMATFSRLIATVVAVAADSGIAILAVVYTVSGLIGPVGGWVLVFFRRAPSLRPRADAFDSSAATSLLKTGLAFTGISIAGLVISYTDLIVITQILGPTSVPPYAIAFSLVMIFVGLEMAILDAAWPAYSESAARGDRAWLVATHRRIMRLCAMGSLTFAVLFVTLGQSVIRVWAGPEVVPPRELLFVLAALAIVQGLQLPFGRMLTALGHVRGNTVLGLANAAINLPLSIFLVHRVGITGVAIGTLVGYLVIGSLLVVQVRSAIAQVGVSEGPGGSVAATEIRPPSPPISGAG